MARWYDDSGRVSGFGAGDVADVRATRDLLGRPVAVDERGLRHELSWDLCGRLVAKRVGDLALTWRYDADGRRVAVGYPDGSETVFGYDAAGRVVSAEHPGLGRVRLDRDACGRVIGLGSAAVRQRWWYWDGELAVLEVEQDGRRRVTELARDAAGRVITEIRDGVARRYRYDPAGQLVAVDAADGIRSFAYDLCGRLVAETGPGGVARYSYDGAGQLVERRCGDSVLTYGYDAAGRRVSEAGPDGARVFTWDALGRLAGVERRSGGSVKLAVDAFGDLSAVDGVPLLWDPTEPVTQPRWMGGLVVAPSWFDADWQGSAGEGGWDPWGAGAATVGPALGWRGELAVDGLVWLRNRCYDPVTRAFLSVDPLPGLPGMPSSGNPYHYAHNDPLNWLDPLGLRPITDAELAAYRDAHTGTLGSWLTDHWGEIATVGLVVAGVAMVATGFGTAAGIGILVGVGSSTLAQYATTGEVNWGKVAVSGAVGMFAGQAGAVVSRLPSVASAGSQLVAHGYPVIGGLSRFVAGGAAAGFTSAMLNETAEWKRGGSFDVDTVAAETLAGGFFGAMGGAAPVADEVLTGTVSNGARNLEQVVGAAGGVWTENMKEMVEHSIEPPALWPALPAW
ncbi:MAG: RHS repeat-associated core domain-containing protein [Egibacteraceae bacterium]